MANGMRRPRSPARKVTAAPDKRSDDRIAVVEQGNTERNKELALRGTEVRTDTGSDTGNRRPVPTLARRPVAGTGTAGTLGTGTANIRDRTDRRRRLLSAHSPENPNCPVCLSACPSWSLRLYKVLLK